VFFAFPEERQKGIILFEGYFSSLFFGLLGERGTEGSNSELSAVPVFKV